MLPFCLMIPSLEVNCNVIDTHSVIPYFSCRTRQCKHLDVCFIVEIVALHDLERSRWGEILICLFSNACWFLRFKGFGASYCCLHLRRWITVAWSYETRNLISWSSSSLAFVTVIWSWFGNTLIMLVYIVMCGGIKLNLRWFLVELFTLMP